MNFNKYKDLFEGKVVLITGGTGFLGRYLTEEILKFDPQSIRLFSRDEVKHHRMQELYKNNPNSDRIRYLIGNVRDLERLEKALSGVDIAIHAAALKRLDILEYNVEESIKTNILGTLNFVKACLKNDIEKGIFTSTDKSCSPINTYGACKFVGERIFTESNYSKGNKKTILSCVRYGNVFGSTGSIVPFFEERIKNNDSIPLTDERMTRFFITPEQAVELVFNSIKYGIGGEVFIPKLPAFKIVDLIDFLKDQHNSKSKIEFVGIRPGEKIHESMLNNSEIRRTYDFEDMFVLTSEIEKYFEPETEVDYIKNGRLLKENEMDKYCSDDNIVTMNEMIKLFQNAGLVKYSPKKTNETLCLN